ncbi:hypothetical protein M565_ctg2P30 [Vibrio cyclitrophicus FF75]|nr:hypothetical protein M565_ctg2P30 [Vibrio cyclitrophicus FF75]
MFKRIALLMALDQVLLSKALKVEEKCQFLSCKSRFNCIF